MIYRVFSDLPTFKELAFRPGLNVLLADKTKASTERQTRNGSGKSSLVELIHFLCGSKAEKGSLFQHTALREHQFGMAFDLARRPVTIQRRGATANQVLALTSSPVADWNTPPLLMSDQGYIFTNNTWRNLLGYQMFGLTPHEQEGPDLLIEPSFRSLFSYFARRWHSGGFQTPLKHNSMQSIGDVQVNLSFLLGLDWTTPAQWERVRSKEKQLRQLRKAAADGLLDRVLGSVAELRARLAVSDAKTRDLSQSLSTFNVLTDYRSLEAEAAALMRQLADLSDANTVDASLISSLERALSDEDDSPSQDVERLYREAGVLLGDLVKKRYEEVRSFHESVVRNRRQYLRSELDAAQRRWEERNNEQARIAKRQAQLMGILQSHGALEQRDALQEELSRLRSEADALRHRLEIAEKLEGTRAELDIERSQLLLRLQQEYRDQESQIQHAIVVFQELSGALYESAGAFSIDSSRNGPEFELFIQGDRSKGISNMQTLCLDLTVMRMCQERGVGPGVLVHDSHLFDGVDSRQVARSLQIGQEWARRFGFQYIVTLNSDAVPGEFPSNFAFEEHVLPVRLTDASEDGGLFGFRF